MCFQLVDSQVLSTQVQPDVFNLHRPYRGFPPAASLGRRRHPLLHLGFLRSAERILEVEVQVGS